MISLVNCHFTFSLSDALWLYMSINSCESCEVNNRLQLEFQNFWKSSCNFEFKSLHDTSNINSK